LSDQTSQRREENSVLIALKELRGMEDARVKREQDEEAARVEAERAAKEAAARRAREEEEARVRAEEERLRRLEEEKQARIREDQLRVEEAERRARVEGEMKLQEERMRLEISARAQHKSPMKAVAAGIAVVLLIGGVVIYRMNAKHQAEQAAQAEQARIRDEQAKARENELVNKIAAIQRDMNEKLKQATTEAERAAIRAEAAQAQKDAAEGKASAPSHTTRNKSKVASTDKPETTSVNRGKKVVDIKRNIDGSNLLDGL